MPYKSFSCIFAFCLFSLVLIAAPVANAGEITLRAMESKALSASYPYTIYLPDGYDTGMLSYPRSLPAAR